ncbi:MAG TPA: hypothetical protein VFA21_06810 [Pyrinomonadaceae bacterium]|nr:hypothetical protein [Pyrinomonadaceae bacterium]
MRKTLTRLLFALALSCAPLFARAPNARGGGAAGRGTAARQRRARAESHPKIRQAIAALEAAKAELEQSAGDFGGHKADAIEAVNNALKRLRLALQFEKY